MRWIVCFVFVSHGQRRTATCRNADFLPPNSMPTSIRTLGHKAPESSLCSPSPCGTLEASAVHSTTEHRPARQMWSRAVGLDMEDWTGRGSVEPYSTHVPSAAGHMDPRLLEP